MTTKTTRDLDLSITIDAPPEAVWRALTEGEELAKWFAPEARVTPGRGGKIWVSWGEGMAVEEPIEIFDAPKHLRHRFGGGGDGKAPLWVDYIIGNDAGTTTLRLVHSGFDSGADWDEEFDSHARGWRIFLANLRHYLEHHRGERVVQRTFTAKIPRDRDAVWGALFAPKALAVVDAKVGAPYRMTLPGGDVLSGNVDIVVPARDLAVTVAELGDGLLRLSLEQSSKMADAPGGKGTLVYGVVIAYGDHVDKAGPLADRLSGVVAAATGA